MLADTKKTPADATEFEREQFRYLVANEDLADTLAELNPSLAWLPMIAEMKIVRSETVFASWIERNFSDTAAVEEVVSNIHFFSPEMAEILEYRLTRSKDLSPLLVKCWRLIIRQMRTMKRGIPRGEWYEIEPRIKRGERSVELLERIVDVLRPKLVLNKRNTWFEEEDQKVPKKPSDLMSIDYEPEEGISDEEILSAWDLDGPAEQDNELLGLLTHALNSTIADATDVEVEINEGYGISDSDVPSVAKHAQNAYRSGFLPIVRVMADLWTRLANKNTTLALHYVDVWQASSFKLVRRLALYAVADMAVSADKAADVLLKLPQGELFLTNSSVEVYRLIDARWKDFSINQRLDIEHRIIVGPPASWFRIDADKEKRIDRCRFDLLGEIERAGKVLGDEAKRALENIHRRWPQWELRPAEQAGFHSWHSSSTAVIGDPEKLKDVPDNALIDYAKKIAESSSPFDGDAWQALCQSDPERALRGLEIQAGKRSWPEWAWRPFLWAGHKIVDTDKVSSIAKLLLNCSEEEFSAISPSASWWLNEKFNSLDDTLLWPLWDRIDKTERLKTQEPDDA